MTAMPSTEDPWLDGLIGAAIIVVSLPSVLAVGVALRGKSQDRLLLEKIDAKQDAMLAKQDETNHLLRILVDAVVEGRGKLDRGGKAPVRAGGA